MIKKCYAEKILIIIIVIIESFLNSYFIKQEDYDGVVDDKLTKKILASALSQQEELQETVEIQDDQPMVPIPKLGVVRL